MEKTKYIQMGHVIAHQSPQNCIEEVEKFCKEKPKAIKIYSTTSLMIGSGNGQAQMIIVTSCLIQWEFTEVQANDFNLALRAKSGIIKTS
jgi:hypothetical protein